ncbi:MAG: hypothetical protein IT249_20850 [Chitinophagaceae bacterium]|nr:hypothetical protein [Chitinophagaceae bacterium]
MEFENFINTLSNETPPVSVSVYVQALWYEGKGDWEKAHDIVQDIHDSTGSWIHAYLHRKEGDNGNARYWYSMAGKSFPSMPLQQEWEAMVKTLLIK